MSAPSDQPTFEQQLKELERVVAEMDRGDVPLETLLANFEKGQKLRQQLESMLNSAEIRIDKLLGDSGDKTAPFDGEDA